MVGFEFSWCVGVLYTWFGNFRTAILKVLENIDYL
jgi:hypothetical protein